ncbi:MAG: hypothetical protein EKK53_23230 [Burkholderiales bacterium]|nr:MAG: hypothetical protein EKK53_23230 [Burkholderiales bacterium]
MHPPPCLPRLRLTPLVALLACPVLASAALPVQLSCTPDRVHRVALTLDDQGAPLGASVSIAAGTRECDLATQGNATAIATGGWRFAWQDDVLGAAYTAQVERSGSGYTLRVQPAACGVLTMPASFSLAAAAKGCTTTVDRQAAFVQFWREFRTAVTRNDGETLVRLSLPQLEFIEDPDTVKAPASVMRHAARCVPDVPAPVQRTDLRTMLKTLTDPRLDMPPLSLRKNSTVSLAGAMTAAWTPDGWRIQGFNASPSVMRDCRDGR